MFTSSLHPDGGRSSAARPGVSGLVRRPSLARSAPALWLSPVLESGAWVRPQGPLPAPPGPPPLSGGPGWVGRGPSVCKVCVCGGGGQRPSHSTEKEPRDGQTAGTRGHGLQQAESAGWMPGVGVAGPGPLPVPTAYITRLLRDGSLRVRPSQATGQRLLTWPAGACIRPGPQP